MQIPYNFHPREYQLPLLSAMDSGYNRAFCLWHRRAGKDKCLWNFTIKKAFERIGVYFYLFPTYTQAKRVIWNGIDNDGFKFLSHIPEELIKSKDATELRIELENGSILQLVGTDNYDSVRGANPVGCVFSEFAFHNPMGWEVVKPILAANNGWAVFNTTPNGKNHAHKIWEHAKKQDNWFTQLLSVDTTGVLSENVLAEEKLEMSREMFEQEYYCSFSVGMVGSVYGEQMELASKQERICAVPIIKSRPIDLYFDLGMSDATAIWFKQDDNLFFNFINYYENSGRDLEHYFSVIDEYVNENFCNIGYINLPHDSKQRKLGMENTVYDQFCKKYGKHKIKVVLMHRVSDGIEKARGLFSRVRIDNQSCRIGIDALENYHYKYDEIKKIFSKDPLHDWSSHAADAFRYFAMENKKDKNISKMILSAPKRNLAY